MIEHVVALDMRKGTGRPAQLVTVRLGESRTQRVVAALTDAGAPYAPGCDSARLLARMRSGARLDAAATVSSSEVSAVLPLGDLTAPDRSRAAYFQLEWADGRTETTEDFDIDVIGGDPS